MATARGITDTKLYDHEAVIDRYGIPPELIPDFYGLKGDTSDNIPGVPGIGDKTAADLLQRFGDARDGARLRSTRSPAPSARRTCTKHADDARISKQLATIAARRAGRLRPRREAVAREPDRSRLREVFREFELRDPLRRLEEALGDADDGGARAGRPSDARARAARGHARRRARARRRRRGRASPCARPRRPRASCSPRSSAWRFGASRAAATVLAGALRRPGRASSPRSATARSSPTTRRRSAPSRRNLAHDTLLAAYLLEPARRGYPLARARARSAAWRADVEDPLAARRRAVARARRLAARADRRARADAAAWRDVELPLVARAARRWSCAGVRLNTRAARGDQRRASTSEIADARARDLGARRRGVHDRLAAAARRDPLREARAVAEAPRQDRLLDRRARAAGDPRRAPDHPEDRALARAQPARRRPTSTCCPQLVDARVAASTRRSCRRRATTGRLALDEPEHAERPGPHRARARDPRLLRGRAAATC